MRDWAGWRGQKSWETERVIKGQKLEEFKDTMNEIEAVPYMNKDNVCVNA